MKFFTTLPLFFLSLAHAKPSSLEQLKARDVPPTPGLTFLYTAFVYCNPPIDIGAGPTGTRLVIPIVGGNFTGPLLSGTILDIGADWGQVDSKGTFSADTRYNLQTNDGANIFIQTSGPTQSDGELFLRIILQTGSPNYYWVNNIVAIGKATDAGPVGNGTTFALKIDAWQLTAPGNSSIPTR